MVAVGVLGAGAGLVDAQVPGAPSCAAGGPECLSVPQQQQVAKIGDDVIARRVATEAANSAVVRQLVSFWVAYASQLGYAVAYSYLPG